MLALSLSLFLAFFFFLSPLSLSFSLALTLRVHACNGQAEFWASLVLPLSHPFDRILCPVPCLPVRVPCAFRNVALGQMDGLGDEVPADRIPLRHAVVGSIAKLSLELGGSER